MKSICLYLIAPLCLAPAAMAAERVVETIPGADFDVGAGPVVRTVTGTTSEPVTGVGLTALWTAVVADTENGVAPWSVDLAAEITAPTGETLEWPLIGGDVTIADYPLQDFVAGLPSVGGQGDFEFSFTSIGNPWVAGLRGVEYHLTTSVPDVVEVFEDSTAEGPMWDRPFFIAGVSGQGPVNYVAAEFTVPVSGGYTFESVRLDGTNNFTFLYNGSFDAGDPLTDLLDYGLGNGNAPNGTPQGTSLISAMLLEGRTYTIVNSQFDRFTPGGDYEMTVTGPAALDVAGACPADLDGSGGVGSSDLGALIAAWGSPAGDPAADLTGDGNVDSSDLGALIAAWGPCD